MNDGDDKIDSKASYVYFKPFNEFNQIADWHFKLNQGESIECLAQGSAWCAVYTDQSYVRIFSIEEVQKYVFIQSSQVVTMTGYENLLVIVYHSGLPINDQ